MEACMAFKPYMITKYTPSLHACVITHDVLGCGHHNHSQQICDINPQKNHILY